MIKRKSGNKTEEVRIRANFEEEAIKQLRALYSDIVSVKIIE